MDEPEIIEAAKRGDVERIAELIAANPDSVNDCGLCWLTALHHAALNDRPKVVKLLLENGANVNAAEINSSTSALAYAVEKGRVEIIRLLLDGGANPDMGEGDYGYTPLHLAALYGVSEVSRQKTLALLGPDAESYISITTAKSMIEMLVEAGGSMNQADRIHGETPLHIATKRGLVDAVATLLAVGADATLKDRKARTPLDVAVELGCSDIADLLRAVRGAP